MSDDSDVMMRKIKSIEAASGDDEDQYLFAHMLERGLGGPCDNVEARRFYGLAAKQGHVDAQFRLASMMEQGKGGSRDDAEARRLYGLAAEQRCTHSKCRLVNMIENGRGCTGDTEETQRLYALAMDVGRVTILYNSAWMYHVGEGVPRDYVEALRLFRLAAEEGDSAAQCILADALAGGTLGDNDEVVNRERGLCAVTCKDEVEARRLYELAVEGGNVHAATALAKMLEEGRGGPVDDEEARRLYGIAAQGNCMDASFRLAKMLEEGRGGPSNAAEALRLYSRMHTLRTRPLLDIDSTKCLKLRRTNTRGDDKSDCGYDSCDEPNHAVGSSGWLGGTDNGNVQAEPPPVSPSRESVVQLIERVRSTRARAPQGTAADVAYVLCAAPAMFPSMNVSQCNELLQAFLARPKQTLARTARTVLFADARSRELACPILTSMVTILDDIFTGQNWDRSVIQFGGTQAVMSVAQFIAELRLAHPEQHAPTPKQREASVLAQYRELHDVFVDCHCVSTVHVNKFFRGELQLGSAGQTTLERAGPECWLALCELMGYPAKPISEYNGAFCTDHMIERSLYTTRGRDKQLTIADTLANYAMLLGFFNEQGRMKVFGMEKRGWYGEKWADMAKTAMRYRLDFAEDNGRKPTTAEFTASTWCKDVWQPTSTLLKHTHPVHTRARKRKVQGHIDTYFCG